MMAISLAAGMDASVIVAWITQCNTLANDVSQPSGVDFSELTIYFQWIKRCSGHFTNNYTLEVKLGKVHQIRL